MTAIEQKVEASPLASTDTAPNVGQLLAAVVAAILLFVARGHLFARPELSGALLVSFGAIYIAGSVILKQPFFLCPGACLWVGTYFLLCHALGVAAHLFPLFSLVPVMVLVILGRGRCA